jgi:hypothetical protein
MGPVQLGQDRGEKRFKITAGGIAKLEETTDLGADREHHEHHN